MNKFILFFTTILTLSTAAFAATPTLKDNMKQMGKLFKALGVSAMDAKQNEASAQASKKLVDLFTAVAQQAPDIIGTLPQGEQKEAIDDYNKMIAQELEMSKLLEQAFLKNDNATAVKILQQMSQTKKQGHEEFTN